MRAASRPGGSPNARAYSRENWVALSYPTSIAAAVTLAPPATSIVRACISRICFWYCRGLRAVTDLNQAEHAHPGVHEFDRHRGDGKTMVARRRRCALVCRNQTPYLTPVWKCSRATCPRNSANAASGSTPCRPARSATEPGGGLNEQFERLLASQTALGRVGEPDDVGRVIATLLSEDSAWINGQSVEVAGGYMI
jgi:hypothetical protein